ncbi:DUF1351 domain-containing protein [Oxalobacter formigenes]|uniref:DUF1351 domain-containing protein n=1 Tax=Oxalobacter formigenes TaxID=847 RepID=UPI0022AE8BD8|nr:DUF1351 domain-containing protein [Oxalobacter formigenes]
MELIITTPDSAFPQLIEFNYEELKAALGNSLEKYDGLVYDESGVKEAKSDRAMLNKLKSAIDSERKSMKARCLAPYEDFERKVKELIGLVDKPIIAIDGQIKKIEDEKKSKKKAEYLTFYEDVGADVTSLVSFESIFQDKWLNSSTSQKAVEDVIKNTVNRIKSDLQTIDSFGGVMTLQCKDVYLQTLNLSDALNEKTRLEELQKRIEQQAETQPVSVPLARTQTQIHSPEKDEPEPVDVEPTYTLAFRVVNATESQLLALQSFLKDHNITFERA